MSTLVERFQKLLEINQSAIEYHVAATALLHTYLPAKIDTPAVHPATDSLQLVRKSELLGKYRPQLDQLDSPEETTQVFKTIYEFVYADLVAIRLLVAHLLSREDPDILALIIKYLYPPRFVEALKFLIDVPQWAYTEFDDKHLDVLNEVAYDIPHIDVKDTLDEIMDAAKKIYPKWALTQSRLFFLLLRKELTYDPMVNVQTELTYENTILQSILQNLGRDSPPTYEGDEAYMYEVMELMTFQLDIIPITTRLMRTSNELIKAKSEYGTAWHGWPPIKHQDYPQIWQFSNDEAKQAIQQTIDDGTQGLISRDVYARIVDILEKFGKIIRSFQPQIPRGDLVREMLNDELYFLDTLTMFQEASAELLYSASLQSDPLKFVSEDRDRFEVLDAHLKDLFFDLQHFEQRFELDKQLIQEMKKASSLG